MNEMQPTKFVRLWLSDKTSEQVAKALGVSTVTMYAYANKLRDLGVDLPARHHAPRTRAINVEKLNALIAQEK